MTKVFVSGSMKIRRLAPQVLARLDRMIDQEFCVLVGDAKGIDSSVQAYLKSNGAQSVRVYCTGGTPRNNMGTWKVVRVESDAQPGSRAYFTAKDIRMAEDCHYGFMIWDCRSIGTLSNAIELLRLGKKGLVYNNKTRGFVTLSEPDDLPKLVGFMAPTAFTKADAQLGIRRRLERLSQGQSDMFSETPSRSPTAISKMV